VVLNGDSARCNIPWRDPNILLEGLRITWESMARPSMKQGIKTLANAAGVSAVKHSAVGWRAMVRIPQFPVEPALSPSGFVISRAALFNSVAGFVQFPMTLKNFTASSGSRPYALIS